jgi:hypothetical protein
MCTPASAFAVVALRARPAPPRPPAARLDEDRPDPERRQGLGLLLPALLAWLAAAPDRARR